MTRLLDLFCGAGGAAVGYHRAGFDEIVGVDIAPQPDYPFEFHQLDVMLLIEFGGVGLNPDEFDLVHASPPCQDYTPMTNRHGSEYPRLIDDVRRLLRGAGVPYVIENVAGSDLVNPIVLTGEMFGLATTRRRLFELGDWRTFQPPIPPRQEKAAAVYGKPDGRRLWTRKDGTELRAWASVEEGQRALGIGWTDDRKSIAEAIPPAYTQWIGERFLELRSAA